MATTIDNFLGISEAALRLRAARSEVLASNLANADTPNYQARDIDFKSILSEYENPQSASELSVTHGNDISASGTLSSPQLMYRIPLQPSVDGNTVDADAEKAAFMKNALQYEATLQFMSDDIKSLKAAIEGT